MLTNIFASYFVWHKIHTGFYAYQLIVCCVHSYIYKFVDNSKEVTQNMILLITMTTVISLCGQMTPPWPLKG